MCVYYIFFIHSSVDGHLGCFHNLPSVDNTPIVDNTVDNIVDNTLGCMYPFELVIFYSLGKYPVVQLLYCRVVLFSTF